LVDKGIGFFRVVSLHNRMMNIKEKKEKTKNMSE